MEIYAERQLAHNSRSPSPQRFLIQYSVSKQRVYAVAHVTAPLRMTFTLRDSHPRELLTMTVRGDIAGEMRCLSGTTLGSSCFANLSTTR